jgi:hypothetical protein
LTQKVLHGDDVADAARVAHVDFVIQAVARVESCLVERVVEVIGLHAG